jgi:hypothetical protein
MQGPKFDEKGFVTKCCFMSDMLLVNMYKMQMRTKYYIVESVKSLGKKRSKSTGCF